ncbi:MAG: DUF4194 domain-containing protein [Pseudomonadota bacterium]|jgi:hypothetical protein|nr:DUF4194 domain-containing protein [Pseudomonadota bacterium]
MANLEQYEKPYSKAIIRLLKSPVERSSPVWDSIIHYQVDIQDFVGTIGLELIIKKDEGFAFIKQLENSDGDTLGLIQRRAVGFEVSIVLIVLRYSLEDFDNNPTQYQSNEKFISNLQIREELELFLQEGYNHLKFQKDMDKYINAVEELGYLKFISEKENIKTYQIQRIIKEKISLDELQDFKGKLNEYIQSI